jgi:phosphoglycerate dehydrogenase-like enzyme
VANGAKYLLLDDLLAESDFVIVTCALTDDTRNMFDKRAFDRMKSSAIFINTSRGGTVVFLEFVNFFRLQSIQNVSF